MRTAVLVVVLLCCARASDAQIGYLWSYQDLIAKSDVVVLATFAETRDTGLKSRLQGLTPGPPVIELRSEFHVVTVLKGALDGLLLTLRHFRLDRDALQGGCLNCGTRVDFTADERPFCHDARVGLRYTDCGYLLFLKRMDDVFEPTSGQVFPTDSIFALRKPFAP
jgi:hypothetical protein